MDDSDNSDSGGQDSVDNFESEKENSENLNVAAGAQPSLPLRASRQTRMRWGGRDGPEQQRSARSA